MELVGKTTINPFLFYSGKIAGYLIWIVLLLSFFDINITNKAGSLFAEIASIVLAIAAAILILLGKVNLGSSTRLGLPKGDTKLKTNGIYLLSRNPIYAGFNLLTLAAVIYTFNFWVINSRNLQHSCLSLYNFRGRMLLRK